MLSRILNRLAPGAAILSVANALSHLSQAASEDEAKPDLHCWRNGCAAHHRPGTAIHPPPVCRLEENAAGSTAGEWSWLTQRQCTMQCVVCAVGGALCISPVPSAPRNI